MKLGVSYEFLFVQLRGRDVTLEIIVRSVTHTTHTHTHARTHTRTHARTHTCTHTHTHTHRHTHHSPRGILISFVTDFLPILKY